MGKIIHSVTNGVASVLSAPYRTGQKLRANRYKAEANILKTARAYDNMPDVVDGKPTDAFKYRTVARQIKAKYAKKKL